MRAARAQLVKVAFGHLRAPGNACRIALVRFEGQRRAFPLGLPFPRAAAISGKAPLAVARG